MTKRRKRRKRPRQSRVLKCLKECMFAEDRKAHKKYERSPDGMQYLETRGHTDDLLDICVPKCHKVRERKPRRKVRKS